MKRPKLTDVLLVMDDNIKVKIYDGDAVKVSKIEKLKYFEINKKIVNKMYYKNGIPCFEVEDSNY